MPLAEYASLWRPSESGTEHLPLADPRASCAMWPATAYAAARAGLFKPVRRQPPTISPLRGSRPPKVIGTACAASTGSRSMAWTWTWGSVLLPELPQRATG